MTKQTIFLSLGTVVLVAGAVGFAFWVHRGDDSSETRVTKNQTSSSAALSNDPSSLSVADTPLLGNNSSAGGSRSSGGTNSLNVLGSSNTTASSTPSSNSGGLPGPESFGQYEEHVGGTSALFADVVEGDGLIAEIGDTVSMVYAGFFTNGELFDRSHLNEENQIVPFTFKLGSGQVIAGWDQSIIGMKEGGKRRLVIPPAVGYGEAGRENIPPNSVLIFDVELVLVQKADTESGL